MVLSMYTFISLQRCAADTVSQGGANEAVIRMLAKIGSPDKVPEFIEKVKKKEAVLSGFGHRVYRTSDPRSFIIRKTAEEVRSAAYDLNVSWLTSGARYSMLPAATPC